MKKLMGICLTALLMLWIFAGCSTADTTDVPSTAGATKGKVVINFEGTVTSVNGEEVTLENGKVIIVTSDTVFAGDPDTNNAVSQEIAAGNFIQGYTAEDPDGDRLTAAKIYCNTAAQSDDAGESN